MKQWSFGFNFYFCLQPLPPASGQDETSFLLVISYPSGQDGPSLPARISRVGPARKSFLFGQIIHSLFGPSLFRQMAEYWPDSFLPFMDLVFVSVRKNAKRGQYPAILTLRLVIATTLWDARRLALGVWYGKSLDLPT